MKTLTPLEHFSHGVGERAFLTSEMFDIQSMIQQLDLFNERTNEALRTAMHKSGSVIQKEMQRFADQTGVDFLSPAITVGKVKARKAKNVTLPWGATSRTDNVIGITVGYHPSAFNYQDTANQRYRTHTVSRNGVVHDGDYWKLASKQSPGVIGLMYEFGRPGKSPAHHRKSPDMEQIRKRIPGRTNYKSWKGRKNWGKAVPTEVKISKGAIQPHPHIRRGFDAAKEQAAQILIDAVNAEIERLNRGE